MKQILLACSGISGWRVVKKADASPCEQFAAQEFVRLFGELTGITLPLCSDSEPEVNFEIVIGQGTRCPKVPLEPVGRGQFDDDVSFAFSRSQLYIHGAGVHGTLNGVYCFFEEYAGVRYVTGRNVYIPRRETFSVPAVSRHITPSLQLRFYSFRSNYDPEFFSYNRINVTPGFEEFDPRFGLPGKCEYLIGHSIMSFVPDSLFDEHPEYFPEINDRRETGHLHQRCLTNPDVLQLAIDRTREALRAHPNQQTIAIGQNDTDGINSKRCQCEKCRAIDEAEGSPMGSLLRFVNAVAEALEPEFPDVIFNTLAYRYTRKAPKITRPRHNVGIVLCSIECCFSHPMVPDCGVSADGGFNGKISNSDFVRDLNDWSKIADRLFIWDYVTNFAHYAAPHPNLHVFAPNLKLMIENNVCSYYPEGAHDAPGSEMDELKNYVLSQLMWNADQDTDLLIDEYLIGRIGMAAAPVGRYLRDLRDRVIRQNYHMSTYETPSKELFSSEWVRFADEMFDRAERLAPNEEALIVVQRMRMSVRYVKICLYDKELPIDQRRLIAETFLSDMVRVGVSKLSEGGTLESARKRVYDYLRLEQ